MAERFTAMRSVYTCVFALEKDQMWCEWKELEKLVRK